MTEFDEAIKEAYASAPTVAAWDTLELWHPTMNVPARVVLDHGALISEEPVTWGRMLTLEADAAQNPGESVLFLAAAIEVTMPSFDEGQTQELTIAIDNVSGSLVPVLKRAIEIAAPIEVTYRQFLENDPAKPHSLLRGLTLRKASASTVRVEGKAIFADLREKAFGKTYTREEFRSLAS